MRTEIYGAPEWNQKWQSVDWFIVDSWLLESAKGNGRKQWLATHSRARARGKKGERTRAGRRRRRAGRRRRTAPSPPRRPSWTPRPSRACPRAPAAVRAAPQARGQRAGPTSEPSGQPGRTGRQSLGAGEAAQLATCLLSLPPFL